MTWLRTETARILRYTRNWLLYGLLGFVTLCIVIGAAKRLLAR
ncbi:MAG: hypothetical protein ACRD9L_28980 [Bryobacteraceae bacterium]